MIRTVYATMSTSELIQFALLRDKSAPLETELAQRLQVAVDMIEARSDEPANVSIKRIVDGQHP